MPRLVIAIALLAPLACGMNVDAATKPAANAASLPGGTWESIAKLPDWAGAWQPLRVPGEAGAPTTRTTGIKFRREVQAKFDAVRKIDEAGGDKSSRNLHCVTRGLPGDMGSAETMMEFGYTPGEIMIVQVEGSVRHIYTDGRPHPNVEDLIDTFQGDSIGHWEGDTLVVDTIAIDAGNEFISGFAQGANSHVTERMHLTAPDVLTIETIIDAPEVLSEPYHFTTRYGRHRDWQMVEFDCAQNNADLDTQTGKQIFASPPPN